jgi:hypothetical protein
MPTGSDPVNVLAGCMKQASQPGPAHFAALAEARFRSYKYGAICLGIPRSVQKTVSRRCALEPEGRGLIVFSQLLLRILNRFRRKLAGLSERPS